MTSRDTAIENCVEMLEEMESNNDHTGVLILVSTLMCFYDYANELETIKKDHLNIGFLTSELYERRENIRNLIRKEGKSHEDWNHYKKFV